MIPVFFVLLFVLVPSLTAVSLKAVDTNQTRKDIDVTEALSKANAGIKTPLIFGDIAPTIKRNATRCNATVCKWPKSGGIVYIPIQINSKYTTAERKLIIYSLMSFYSTTCIRFIWRRSSHRDFLYFFSGSGCWSYLGRQGGRQRVSLKKNGCLYKSTVQHEVNHALGVHHEHARSDRDNFVRILTQNIRPGKEHNFEKVQTNNLGTPYDFNSVMHYTKFAFSRNRRPTILSIANPNLDFGRATTMSVNDINRIKRLYGC
ncbi:high choriolytic enzyme 1-like isoform X2 [Girardinichthys multiradiatus]|nr:high choriolytic enzyme 1-like isoform X2 [Girardinichthys multiradiatus]